MSYFAVIRAAGPGWTNDLGAFEQPEVNEHTAFMKTLVDHGVVLLGGPLAGSEQGRMRVLLIVDAGNETEIRSRLSHDPWALTQRLVVVSIEPWNVFVGAERLSSTSSISGGSHLHRTAVHPWL